MQMSLAVLAPVAAVIALIVAFALTKWITGRDAGNDRMKEISGYIHEGAMAFLTKEYRFMIIVVVVLAVLICLTISPLTAGLYVFGAFLSVLAGFFGMQVATKGNVRTAAAAEKGGMVQALAVAFRSGAVMGLCVAGLGLLGVGIAVVAIVGATGGDLSTLVQCITGFSLGASSMALFGRVGGGIYTKAADVGADLVGKVEAGIPEDDPRNPAVIADNVGDNVGDVAGMGSDLYESYVGSIISAITLAAIAALHDGTIIDEGTAILFPLLMAAIGLVASVIGILLVRGKEGSNPANALNMGTYISSAIVIVAVLIMSKTMNMLRRSLNSPRLVPRQPSSAVWASACSPLSGRSCSSVLVSTWPSISQASTVSHFPQSVCCPPLV